jgi:hypothetical protein
MYLISLSGKRWTVHRGAARRRTCFTSASYVSLRCAEYASTGRRFGAHPRALIDRAPKPIFSTSILTGSGSWPATTGMEPSCERVRLA